MARYERFSFLCDPSERRAIAELAQHLQRSQSDAVRFVVIEAARQLGGTDGSSTQERGIQQSAGNTIPNQPSGDSKEV